ncbi:MAG: 6-bladed beta-propeller [Bacteroidetes bacterium]|nr:6-bladed beta-propeller [Bacteroidota bacterium]MCY4205839.1 6-bladed beta-propeller [Bacteroidota bacterium]
MNRREFNQRTAQVAALGFFPVDIIIKDPEPDELIGHGDYRYKVHRTWGQQDPAAIPVKNCHEMVQDRAGRLIMIGDDIRNNILIYDTSGNVLDTWGDEYPYGHGLTLWDEGGEEFLFICDNGFDGNPQVVKTTLAGNVVMKLPHPQEIGVYEESDAYHPTETAIGPNGDIYVADGYGAQWILQFNHEGEFIRRFGGKGDEDHQFQTAHGVCVDLRNPDQPSLVCTSRGHNAFKRFSLSGEYLSTVFLPGAYVCRAVIHKDMLYSGVCWSRLRYLNQTPDSGFVTILDSNDRVVSNPGGTMPVYRDGELQLMLQAEPIFNHCHDVCVDKDENLYICQWNAGQTYPIKLERI